MLDSLHSTESLLLALQRLARGESIKLQELAVHVGIDAAALEDLVRWLEGNLERGLSGSAEKDVVAQPPFELLDESAIRLGLSGSDAENFDIQVLTVVDSTNSYLRRETHMMDRPRAVVAEIQTAGRGRHGRRWHSALGGGLYLSLMWPFATRRSDLGAISLAVAITIASTLRREGVEACVKWPNDVLVGDAKLAGVLPEAVQNGGGTAVIVGVGLNIYAGPKLRLVSGRPVIGLAELLGDRGRERNRILGSLLSALIDCCRRFERGGFSGFVEQWPYFDALKGRLVRLERQTDIVEGRALGVDPTGALLLEHGGRITRHHSGEAWLKVSQ